MAKCQKCGAELAEDAKFCPDCGAAIEAEEVKEAAPAAEAAEPAVEEAKAEETAAEEVKAEEAAAEEAKAEETKAEETKAEETKTEPNAFDKFMDTPDSTAEMDAKDIEDNKLMGILAYLSWLVLIPIFAARESKFARFHANQGLLLAIAEIVVGIVLAFLSWIPYVGWIFSIIGGLFGLVCLLYLIIGILNVAEGKAKELPVIGKFRILK